MSPEQQLHHSTDEPVMAFSAMRCERLELVVVEPSLDQLLEAGTQRGLTLF